MYTVPIASNLSSLTAPVVGTIRLTQGGSIAAIPEYYKPISADVLFSGTFLFVTWDVANTSLVAPTPLSVIIGTTAEFEIDLLITGLAKI
jgi:hypothetical protein